MQKRNGWLVAASRYSEKEKADLTAIRREDADAKKQERIKIELSEEFNRRKAVATQALREFLQSEDGLAAIELLKTSKRHINFAVDVEDSQTTVVYLLDDKGLQMCVEPSASQSNAYATLHGKKLAEPRFSTMTPADAVDVAVRISKQKPEEIMEWLIAEIDKVAAAAPQQQ